MPLNETDGYVIGGHFIETVEQVGYQYQSSKMFGPYSVAFRQHKASSHCRFLHGYGLTFTCVFGCTSLDDQNWVFDYGGFKALRGTLEAIFDHRTLIAQDDPLKDAFRALEEAGGCQISLVPRISCEMFAQYVLDLCNQFLRDNAKAPRVWCCQVTCQEHELNAAMVRRLPVVSE